MKRVLFSFMTLLSDIKTTALPNIIESFTVVLPDSFFDSFAYVNKATI